MLVSVVLGILMQNMGNYGALQEIIANVQGFLVEHHTPIHKQFHRVTKSNQSPTGLGIHFSPRDRGTPTGL